jgi:hypothetical protein
VDLGDRPDRAVESDGALLMHAGRVVPADNDRGGVMLFIVCGHATTDRARCHVTHRVTLAEVHAHT